MVIVDSRANISEKSWKPRLLHYSSEGRGGGIIRSESSRSPAFFLVKRLTQVPKVRAPLSSTFGDIYARRRACKTGWNAPGEGEGDREKEPLLGSVPFPCSGCGELTPTEHAPSLITLALLILPSQWRTLYPLLCRCKRACICVSFLLFSPLLVVISHVAILSFFAPRRCVAVFPQYLPSLSRCILSLASHSA